MLFVLVLSWSVVDALPYFSPSSIDGYAPLGDGRDSPDGDLVGPTCGAPATDISQIISFCSEACNASSSCTGFVITNQQFPIGCCYLKNSLKDVNSLGIFLNNVVGQTYKKTFIGLGNEPTRAGYQLMGLKDSPYNDIPGACWITLDACFQLCDSKGNDCKGFTFRFDHNQFDGTGNCCYLKYQVSSGTLGDFRGSDFGITYAKSTNAVAYFATAIAGYSTYGYGQDSKGYDLVGSTCGAPATSISDTMSFCSQACNATSVGCASMDAHSQLISSLDLSLSLHLSKLVTSSHAAVRA